MEPLSSLDVSDSNAFADESRSLVRGDEQVQGVRGVGARLPGLPKGAMVSPAIQYTPVRTSIS
jgi:hypothetical protein